MITHPDELNHEPVASGSCPRPASWDAMMGCEGDSIGGCIGASVSLWSWGGMPDVIIAQWRLRGGAVHYVPPGGVCCDGFPHAGFLPVTERWCRHIPAFGSRTVPADGGLPILPAPLDCEAPR